MNMRVSDAINTFVGQFFPLFSDPNLGLFFNIDHTMADYRTKVADQDNKMQAQGVITRSTTCILITRPMNNAHVYVQHLDALERLELSRPFEMDLMSMHNSCWQDAVNDALIKADAEPMREHYDNGGCPWNELSEHTTFSVFQPPTFVLIKTREKTTDDVQPHGRWRITVEKKLTTREAALLMNEKPDSYAPWR